MLNQYFIALILAILAILIFVTLKCENNTLFVIASLLISATITYFITLDNKFFSGSQETEIKPQRAIVYTITEKEQVPNFIISVNSIKSDNFDIICIVDRDLTDIVEDIQKYVTHVILVNKIIIHSFDYTKIYSLKLQYDKMLLIDANTIFNDTPVDLFNYDAPSCSEDHKLLLLSKDEQLYDIITNDLYLIKNNSPCSAIKFEEIVFNTGKLDSFPNYYTEYSEVKQSENIKCILFTNLPQLIVTKKSSSMVFYWRELWADFISKQPRYRKYLDISVEYFGCEKNGYKFKDNQIVSANISSYTKIIRNSEEDRVAKMSILGEKSNDVKSPEMWTCLRKIVTPSRTVFHKILVNLQGQSSHGPDSPSSSSKQTV